MHTSFHLNTNELNEDFLRKVKTLFKGKRISITIEEEVEMDETEFLLANPKNVTMLRKSIAEADKGELVKVNIGKKRKK